MAFWVIVSTGNSAVAPMSDAEFYRNYVTQNVSSCPTMLYSELTTPSEPTDSIRTDSTLQNPPIMLSILAGYAHPGWPDVLVRTHGLFAYTGFAHMQTVCMKDGKMHIGCGLGA